MAQECKVHRTRRFDASFSITVSAAHVNSSGILIDTGDIYTDIASFYVVVLGQARYWTILPLRESSQ
jgi:hypothetical protein